MSQKESRHTCVVCGRKRNKQHMEIVKDHCHTGKSQWACINKSSAHYNLYPINKTVICSVKYRTNLLQ